MKNHESNYSKAYIIKLLTQCLSEKREQKVRHDKLLQIMLESTKFYKKMKSEVG